MLWKLEKLRMILYIGRDAATQVTAALDWINTAAQENDRILIEFPNYRRVFYFEFPLRFGDPPRPLRKQDKEATFIIRRPHPNENIPQDEKWQRIFSSPELEILENKERKAAIPPLHWGLTDEEKRLAFKIAREALARFLSESGRLGQEYFRGLPPRFFLKTDLDVALWVKGRGRGSAVITNKYLGEGIAEAAISAGRDARCKPLALEELQDTRIEITLIAGLLIPLSTSECWRNSIYPEKGYLLRYHSRQEWFLPEVFNATRFRNFEEFLDRLAKEKIRLPRHIIKDIKFFICEVDDFIESKDHERALSLWGPIVGQNSQFSIFNFQSRLQAAADWLCNIQEPDGNLPPIINPLTGRHTQIDWPRLAFTAWALAEFGKATKEESYVKAAAKSAEYLKKYLLSDFGFRISGFELTLAYFGQLSLALGKLNDAATAANKILDRLNNLNFEAITFAQIAGFLKITLRHGIVRAESRTYFDNLLKILKEKFGENLKSRQPIHPVSGRASNGVNLAVWAELVNTFWGVEPEFSRKVAEWLKKQQLASGAFPESTTSDFVYTSGIGKIFEVLALDSEENKEALDRALQWLLSMQYDEENTFFVPEEIRPKIRGAFRNNYFNPEARIDSAGHILLGGSRVIT